MGKERFSADIGCGLGNSSVDYLSLNGPVVGVDRDLEILKKNKHVPQGKLIPVCADAAHLPFKEASFETVACSHVLEHLPPGNEQEALAEINRVLVSGGRAILSVPHPRFEGIMGRLVKGYHSENMHQQVISPQRLIEEAHHQGLRVLALEKRRWFAALGLIGAGILNRISPKTLSFESQTGFSKSPSLPIVKKLYWLAEIIGQKSEHLPLLSRLFNKILPFETFIIAEKRPPLS